MANLTEVIPLIVGAPQDDLQTFVLYLICGAVGIICIMFFLKLFLLIGGYLKP